MVSFLCVGFYAHSNQIYRMNDAGETGSYAGAEGEREISQAKGPGQDDTS